MKPIPKTIMWHYQNSLLGSYTLQEHNGQGKKKLELFSNRVEGATIHPGPHPMIHRSNPFSTM
nr:hypothetical protein Itr_chr07CG19000 [Ipomoea trifida]